ncbi:MAG: VWA domain-containing protein [Vicinamibacterales bacterium]
MGASAGSAAALAQEPAAQTPSQALEQPGARFKSAVDLVSVVAVVRDRKGRFVPDLSQRDFIVVESGQSRPIVGFKAEADGPVRLAIVFDVSGSMQVGTKAADAKAAARQILSTLGGGDQAALFSFDTKLERVRDFTSDFAAVDAALDTVDKPYGQTSLYDAVAETARAVAGSKDTPTPQRSAVVVLTDGVDTHSRLTPGQVSGIASEIDVPVYVVAVMSEIDDPRIFDAPEAVTAGGLRDLAHWTGGELFTVSAPAQTTVAARQIVSELRHQYLLAFEASPTPGWRSLEIKARSRDLIVRARSGYTSGVRPTAVSTRN